jgi:two-component system cell cycle sensor histidine kinase/response regulator CckA
MPDDVVSHGVPWQVRAVDALDAGVALVVAGRGLVETNEAARRLLDQDEHGRPVQPAGDPSGTALTERRAMVADLEVRGSDGRSRRVQCRAVPVTVAGEPAVVTTYREVTEQARADEAASRLAVALDATGDGMATFDRDLIVTSWNAAAEKLSGFPAGQIVGRDVSALAPLALMPADAARLAATYEAVLAGQVLEREGPHRTASGQEIVLRTLIYPTRDETGAVTGGLVLGRDVTAERAAEEERLQLQQQVEHLQRLESLGQLAGGVAHDFNNLLAVINLTAEVLEASLPAGSAQRAQTQQILAAAARGVALTRKMLVFAHREPAQRAVVDLNDVVRRAELLLDPTLGERIGRTTDLVSRPTLVSGDPLQLEQAVINLAANARDAMPDGRGRLRIATRVVPLDEGAAVGMGVAPGEYAVMSVSDDGAGMDEQTRAHAVEPFFTTKPPGQGTGLGLAMVYGVVTSVGGALQVRSQVGEGTTVDVYLPLVEGVPDPAPERRPPPEPGRGELVLVVEDAAELRDLVVAVLTRAGYRVIAHADPGQALAAPPAGVPDLLVTDVVMPGMDGPMLAVELRARYPGLRVLLMSGYRPEEARGRSEPGDRVLPKPFVADDLLHAVRDVLDDGPPAG